jgi:hypothetical protein
VLATSATRNTSATQTSSTAEIESKKSAWTCLEEIVWIIRRKRRAERKNNGLPSGSWQEENVITQRPELIGIAFDARLYPRPFHFHAQYADAEEAGAWSIPVMARSEEIAVLYLISWFSCLHIHSGMVGFKLLRSKTIL